MKRIGYVLDSATILIFIFVWYVDILIHLKNIEKLGIIIPSLVTSDSADCSWQGFKKIKKMLEDPRDQNSVASVLYTNASKAIAMIDTYQVLSQKQKYRLRESKHWFIQGSQIPYLVIDKLGL